MKEETNRKYLYRYMHYTEFSDMIRLKRLTLKYPGKWEDNLELLFLKCFENKVRLEKLLDEYRKKSLPNTSEHDIKSDFQIISSWLLGIRCQCWTHKEDDLIMWNARNSTETIRICVNREVFDRCKEDTDKEDTDMVLVHRDVDYQPEISIESIVEAFFKNDRRIHPLVFTKKDVFSYEEEYRIAIIPPFSFRANSYGNTLSEFLQNHFYEVKAENGVANSYLRFNINNIEDVKVHPNASESFASLIEADCKSYGIKYCGKSKILD